MSKTFKQIQEEMVAWQQHNFPGRSSWMPLMGLGEELGELADAISVEDIEDAIGDCCIYLADYCNGMGYDLDFINEHIYVNNGDRSPAYASLLIHYGKLCHSHLKQVQRIRMHENHKNSGLYRIACILYFLRSFKQNLEDIAWETWLKVRQRDWQKDANKAHMNITKEMKETME